MEGCARAAKRKADLAMSQAWHTVAFDRMKHHDFKNALSKLLRGPVKQQTPDEMLEVLRSISGRGVPMNFKQIN